MKKRTSKKMLPFGICIMLVFTLPIITITTATHVEKIEVKDSNERPFYISTSGTTCPGDLMHNKGWCFIFHMLRPWPDQTYFTLFGIINYENGTTVIINNDTGETVQQDGAHKVLFFNFYGSISSAHDFNVSFEGNTVYARVIGG